MTLMCVRCYIEGRQISPRMNESNPPFAIMIYEGESRCKEHLPEEAAGFTVVAAQAMPADFGTFSPLVEEIQTDNRFIVSDEPAKQVTPAKKTAKKTPQQRKRTKS